MSATGSLAQLAYTGPASDGGSIWCDSNNAAWHLSGSQYSSPQTLECWVWLHKLATQQQKFFMAYSSLGVLANGQPCWFSNSGNITLAPVLSEQVWHHLVGTYGPTNGSRLYLDGALYANAAYGAAFVNQLVAEAIGTDANGTNLASANIAECAIYNVELSAARILAHYNAADTRTARPVFRQAGTWDATGGGSTFVPENLVRVFPSA
jgi:hypothetical protein